MRVDQISFPIATSDVLGILPLTGDQLRHACEFLLEPKPQRVGRGYAWSADDVLRLARCTNTLTPRLAAALLKAAQDDAAASRRRVRRLRVELGALAEPDRSAR